MRMIINTLLIFLFFSLTCVKGMEKLSLKKSDEYQASECKILLKNSAASTWAGMQAKLPPNALEIRLDPDIIIQNIATLAQDPQIRVSIIHLIEKSDDFRRKITENPTACHYFIDTLLSVVNKNNWTSIESIYGAERNSETIGDRTFLFNDEKFVLQEQGRYKAYAVCYAKKIGFAEIVINTTGGAHLQSIVIAPSARQRGVGTQLMGYVLRKLKERGHKLVTAHLAPMDLSPREATDLDDRQEIQNRLNRFFGKCGFRKIEPYNSKEMVCTLVSSDEAEPQSVNNE